MLRRSIEGARFGGVLFALNAEHQAKCERCGLPLAEVDAYGERLRGCVGCNH